MLFHWDDENRLHLARHGVSEAQVEAAFQAEDATLPGCLASEPLGAGGHRGGPDAEGRFRQGFPQRLPGHHGALDELETQEDVMTIKKAKHMSMVEFEQIAAPGEPLEALRARQETDAAWAERAFRGEEALGAPIRIQRGRPRTGESAAPTVVKAIRLPEALLKQIQTRAKSEGLSLNALLQMAIAEYLVRHRGA
jgi:hypothetical protein